MSNEPLGLPRGSVRAILALFTVGSSILANVALIFTAREADPALIGLASGVLFYYFGTREQAPPADEPLPLR